MKYQDYNKTSTMNSHKKIRKFFIRSINNLNMTRTNLRNYTQ